MENPSTTSGVRNLDNHKKLGQLFSPLLPMALRHFRPMRKSSSIDRWSFWSVHAISPKLLVSKLFYDFAIVPGFFKRGASLISYLLQVQELLLQCELALCHSGDDDMIEQQLCSRRARPQSRDRVFFDGFPPLFEISNLVLGPLDLVVGHLQ